MGWRQECFSSSNRIQVLGLKVIFIWAPANIGVIRNEMRDKVAKRTTRMKKHKHKLMEKCQNQWEEERKGRHYCRIQRRVREHEVCGGERRVGGV